MAVKDVTITLTGAGAVVSLIDILPQPDGSLMVQVAGQTKDLNGNQVTLSVYQHRFQPGDLPALDQLVAAAIVKLRQLNGLE